MQTRTHEVPTLDRSRDRCLQIRNNVRPPSVATKAYRMLISHNHSMLRLLPLLIFNTIAGIPDGPSITNHPLWVDPGSRSKNETGFTKQIDFLLPEVLMNAPRQLTGFLLRA